MEVDRIKIYGSPGSGKTSLATQLSEILKQPVFHIDDIYWLENWEEQEAEKFRNEINEIVKKERWIIDGNYARVKDIIHPRCTLVVILKTSLFVVFWRLVIRSLARRGIIEMEVTQIPANITNETGALSAVRTIIELTYHAFRYKFTRLGKIKKECVTIVGEKNVLVLRTKKQISRFLLLIQENFHEK